MNITFVNATALSTGGGLSTLRQFLENIPEECTSQYYIFCSLRNLENEFPKKNIYYVYPKYITGLKRIYWDMYGFQKWSNDNCIKPDLVISLQNTTVRFDNEKIPQISYVMQAIPFVNKKWNIFKKQERTLWFYKNIYPYFMSMDLGKKHYVVTQSKWIKYEFQINLINTLHIILDRFACFDTLVAWITHHNVNHYVVDIKDYWLDFMMGFNRFIPDNFFSFDYMPFEQRTVYELKSFALENRELLGNYTESMGIAKFYFLGWYGYILFMFLYFIILYSLKSSHIIIKIVGFYFIYDVLVGTDMQSFLVILLNSFGLFVIFSIIKFYFQKKKFIVNE